MEEQQASIRRRRRGFPIGKTTIILIVVVVLASAGVGAYLVFPRPDIVRIDGSSTVFPITSAWAAEYNTPWYSTPYRQVVVAFSGTGGGFAKWCRGETDLNDASRPIRQSEIDGPNGCTAHGITNITEFRAAYDGLSIVVNPQNTWVANLTVSQLCRIWTSNGSAGACGGAGGRVTTWSGLNSTWPAEAIQLYGPGTASGTFDYFVEVILGNRRTEHTDQYFGSEDDNVLVQGVSSNRNALGYFGYAYAVRNPGIIRILPIDNEDGDGAIAPTEATIRDSTYEPLSRPLYVYGNARSLARQIVQDYLEFGYSARGTQLVDDTGYVSLTEAEREEERLKIP
jgi:phosphate transport system substrate-binding protein